MIKCTKCSMPAVIYQRYSGLHLCNTHFFEDVERKFKLTIRKDYKINKNDKIIVGFSGGKDSSLLLYLLNKFFSIRKDIELIAVTIDEGISGYRECSIKKALEFTKRLNIKHEIYSFKKEYNITMDSIVKKKVKYKNERKGACSYCGVLRKKLLNKIAKEMNGTKLAIGHNLDDEAQTIMLNYLSGNINKMAYFSNKLEKEGFVKRIKPLKKIPEQEVSLYAYLKNMPMELYPCPYSFSALRKEIRISLNEFELNHPGTKYSLLRGFNYLGSLLNNNIYTGKTNYCKSCGEPCNGNTCQSCKLLCSFIK